MLRNFAIALTGVAVLVVAANLQAQAPARGRGMGGMMGGAGGGMLMLLQNEQVQKEIELVADQKEKLTALNKETEDARPAQRAELRNLSQEERLAKMKEAADKVQKKVEVILLPHQLKRIKQIQLQMRGVAALVPEDVKVLALTDDQKAKLKTINDDAQKARQEMFSGGMRNLSAEDRAKIQTARADTEKKAMAVLTADQKKKFEEMTGPKFDTSSLMRGRGGAGRNRGGGTVN